MSGAGYNEALTIEELYAKQSHNESAAGRGSTLFVELNDYGNEIINTDTDTDRVGRTSSISARSRSGSASRSNSPSFKGIDPKKNVNRRKSMASFGDAMTPKDQIALIVETKKKEKDEELTFKPRRYSMDVTAILNQNDGAGNDVDYFQKLHDDAAKLEEKKKVLTDRKEAEVLEELSFKPQLFTSQNSRTSLTRRRSVSEALLPTATTLEKKDAEPKEEFKPKITRRASSVQFEIEDVGERMMEAAKDYAENKRRLTIERDAELTFSPKLNNNRGTKSDGNVLERMEEAEKKRLEEISILIKEKEDKFKKEFRFKPRVKVHTNASDNATPNRENVFSRLANSKPLHEKRSKSPQSLLRGQSGNGIFERPSSSTKKKDRYGELSEKKQAFYDKLYDDAAKIRATRDELKQEKDQQEASKYHFKPKINPAFSVRRSILPSGDVFDRLNDHMSLQDRSSELEYMRLEIEMKECTFKPKVNTLNGEAIKNRRGTSTIPFHERMKIKDEKKLAFIETLKQERELEQKACETFKPHLETHNHRKYSSVAAKTMRSPAKVVMDKMDALLHKLGMNDTTSLPTEEPTPNSDGGFTSSNPDRGSFKRGSPNRSRSSSPVRAHRSPITRKTFNTNAYTMDQSSCQSDAESDESQEVMHVMGEVSHTYEED